MDSVLTSGPMGARAGDHVFPPRFATRAVAGRYAEGFLAADRTHLSCRLRVLRHDTVRSGCDEANSVLISSRNFPGIIQALSLENSLPGYSLLLAAWMRLFGDSEIALGPCPACLAGRLRAGPLRSDAGWWAMPAPAEYSALFYECSAIAIRQAQNIRMYTMLGMLAAYWTVAFVRIFRDGDRSRRASGAFLHVVNVELLTHVRSGSPCSPRGLRF